MTSQLFQPKNPLLPPTSGYVLRDAQGHVLYTNTGSPIYAPDSYVPNTAAASFVAGNQAYDNAYYSGFLANTANPDANPIPAGELDLGYLKDQFRTNGPLDLQRSYNQTVSGGEGAYVPAFTP